MNTERFRVLTCARLWFMVDSEFGFGALAAWVLSRRFLQKMRRSLISWGPYFPLVQIRHKYFLGGGPAGEEIKFLIQSVESKICSLRFRNKDE